MLAGTFRGNISIVFDEMWYICHIDSNSLECTVLIMRILLIATNRHNRWMTKDEVRPLPIGLAYVAAYINADRHSVRILDLMFSDDPLSDTERAVKEYRPDIVGTSLRNLDNGSFTHPESALATTKNVIQTIRQHSNALVTCGGPAFSILPENCFNYLEPDVGLVGDSAECFADLADLMEDGKSWSGLPGIIYRDGGGLKVAEQKASSTLSKPPKFDDLDLELYKAAGFGVGIITKLGWYSSTVSSPTPDEEWRIVRPVQEVIDEISRLNNAYGLREFFFIDQEFNRPIDYAKQLCSAICDMRLDITWNTNISPSSYDDELISLLNLAGCQMVLIRGGAIKGNVMPGDTGEEQMRLGADLADVQKLCEMCHKHDLPYSITQGFGEIGETDQTVRDKLAFLSTAASSGRSSNVTLRIGTRLYPGTELASRAVNEGIINCESELLMPVYYVSQPVRSTLMGILQEAIVEHPAWTIL